jgi:hypothetical protein
LPEPGDQLLDRGGIEEPAEAKRADDEPDRGKAEPKALIEVRAHIGKGAPSDHGLD